jgi:hypothetical protein
MKVLEAGRKQKGWSHEFRCTGDGNDGGGCGALLLVEQGDLFTTASHARDETTTYKTFRCSECGVNTDIENDESGKRLVPRTISVPAGVKHKDGGYTHPDDPTLPDTGDPR